MVNACLARKGIDDWLVKQKYYCTSSRLEQQDCLHRKSCGLSARVSPGPSMRVTVHGEGLGPISRTGFEVFLQLCAARVLILSVVLHEDTFSLQLMSVFNQSLTLVKLSESFVGGQTFNTGGESFNVGCTELHVAAEK